MLFFQIDSMIRVIRCAPIYRSVTTQLHKIDYRSDKRYDLEFSNIKFKGSTSNYTVETSNYLIFNRYATSKFKKLAHHQHNNIDL